MDENTSVVPQANQKQVKQPAATRWRKLLEDQRVSGLPVSAFCRERGIPTSSLFAWRRRLEGGVAFKSVELIAHAKSKAQSKPQETDVDKAIELCLCGGRRLIVVRRGFDRQLLLDLIDVLESRS